MTGETEARRVLLVEDEAMSRSLLANVLTTAGFDVDACSSVDEAMASFKAFDPDAVVTDIDLGRGPSGLDLVVSLAKRAPYLAFVILSNYSVTPEYRKAPLGGAAYLRKQDLDEASVLIDALEAVLLEQRPAALGAAAAQGRLAVLTRSQVEVLSLMANGLSNEEIARQRHTSVKSVENITSRIFHALGLAHDPAINMRVAAVRVYIEEAGPRGVTAHKHDESRDPL